MQIEKQLHISLLPPLKEEIAPARNSADTAFIRKPQRQSGLWTSTWDAERKSSEWIDWCVGAEYVNVVDYKWYLLTPRSDVKLYVIDSVEDLKSLIDEYPYNPKKYAYDAYYSAHVDYRSIDFERVGHSYDGIWLTEHGNAKTHLSRPLDLNSWDCECVLWLRGWPFTQVEEIEAAIPKEE